jgi:hypothetical protein
MIGRGCLAVNARGHTSSHATRLCGGEDQAVHLRRRTRAAARCSPRCSGSPKPLCSRSAPTASCAVAPRRHGGSGLHGCSSFVWHNTEALLVNRGCSRRAGYATHSNFACQAQMCARGVMRDVYTVYGRDVRLGPSPLVCCQPGGLSNPFTVCAPGMLQQQHGMAPSIHFHPGCHARKHMYGRNGTVAKASVGHSEAVTAGSRPAYCVLAASRCTHAPHTVGVDGYVLVPLWAVRNHGNAIAGPNTHAANCYGPCVHHHMCLPMNSVSS